MYFVLELAFEWATSIPEVILNLLHSYYWNMLQFLKYSELEYSLYGFSDLERNFFGRIITMSKECKNSDLCVNSRD